MVPGTIPAIMRFLGEKNPITCSN